MAMHYPREGAIGEGRVFASPDEVMLARVSEAVTGLPLSGCNSIAMLHNGEEAYPAMLEAIGQDFIRSARARGLGDRAVLLRHAQAPVQRLLVDLAPEVDLAEGVAAVEAAGRDAFGAASAAVTVARMAGMAFGMAVLTAFGTTRIDQVTVALEDQAYRDAILPAELVGQPLGDPLVKEECAMSDIFRGIKQIGPHKCGPKRLIRLSGTSKNSF